MITRVNRNTVVDISANFAAGTSLSNVQAAFLQHVAALHLPKNIQVRPRPLGSQDLMNQTLGALALTLEPGSGVRSSLAPPHVAVSK